MRVLKFTLLIFTVFGFYAAKAQLPIAYYDFEDNSARNTTIETTLETAVSTIGTPTITDANGLTSSDGVGNGAGYGGSNTGYALGYYGFTTGGTVPTAAASNSLPHIIFGPFTTTGLQTITLTMDLMGIGDKRPGNAVIYWSTDNLTYTRVATYPAVGTSFATQSFTLPAGANNQAALYIRVLGYNPSNAGTPDNTNGVMKIDNFTLRSSQFNAALTLANANTHGTGLTSGDTYLPTYSSFILSPGAGNDVTMASPLTLTGYVDLTSGNLAVGANTLTFQVHTGNGSTTGPIRKSGSDVGFIVFGTTSNMVIGDGTETVATTIPNNAFSAPSGMGNLTINRNTAQVNWGNNPIRITGDLNVSSGIFIQNNASGTIDVDGNANVSNIGEFRASGTNALNVDGNIEITNDGIFRVTANNANVAVGGSLNINNNGQAIFSGTNSGANVSIAIAANLEIGSAATLDLANNTTIVQVTGNVTGSGTISSAASNRRLVIIGTTSTLSSSIFYGNVEINTTGTVSLTGSTVFTGFIRLTGGTLAVGNNTLSLTAPAIAPIQRNGGTQLGLLSMGASSTLEVGDGTQTAGITFPNSFFTTPTNFSVLTVNRSTGTVNWGNNPVTLSSNLNITAGAGGIFVINNAAGIIGVGGNLNVNDGTFRISVATDIPVTGNLNLFGDLSLTNASANLVVTGNVTGSGTHTAASLGQLELVGIGSTISNTITYDNVNINTTGAINLTGSTTIGGSLRLTAGVLNVGAANTLTLTLNGSPVLRNGGSETGTITMAATSVFTCGDGSQTLTTTLANSIFTSPTSFATLNINRASGTTNWGDNPITLTGNANIDAGTGNFIINNSVGIIGVGGNLNVNSGEFRISVAADMLVTGNLNLVSTLGLTNAASNLVVTGNVTGSGTHTAASLGQLELVGIGSTISNTITYDNVNINTTGAINLTGSTTIGGTLRLTAGVLNVGAANTLTLTYNGSPVIRNGGSETGTITTAATSVFTCGDGSQTATTTLANSIFTTPTNFATLNINRASGTTNWGNNPITLTGNAEITAGSGYFILNNLTGTIDIGGNLNINSGEFRVSVGSNNTVTGNLNILGTLGLTATTAYITVSGSVTGTGSQTLASTGRIVMVGTGANTLASTITYDNVEINTATGISLTGSTTFTGNLRLTTGSLNVGANTITFHTDNTPLSTTGGTLNLTSTSSLRFGNAGNVGGNNFTIPNSIFTGSNIEFANLYINRTNRIVLNNQNFAITGFLGIEAGQLALPAGYLFTLRSTSITNTAMVSEVGTTGVITYGTGAAFRVERFIPQTGGTGVRAYRDFAPSVNSGTGTIYANWQEGGTNGLDAGVYYGTHITGFVGASGIDAGTGFDKTYSGSGSLSTFDISTVNGSGTWYTWSSATSRSTNQTNDTLSAFKGYRVLIRGNRLVDLTLNPTPTGMNSPATLRSIGKLVYGDVLYSTTGVTANGATNTGIRLNSFTSSGYTMVGNPYACPIDWELVHADVGTTNLSSTYYVFDPNLSTNGAYATYNATSHTTAPVASDANQYIQPGQAFFVRNSGGSTPTLTIRESHKAANVSNLTNTFKASSDSLTISKIYINLNKEISVSNYKLADGVAVVFNNTFSDGDGPEDAGKISNNLENLSIISKNNKQWIIEGRQQAYANDSVQLRMYYGANSPIGGNYNLEINMDHFINNGLQAYLFDSYTNTLTTLGMTGVSTYNYTVTNVAATYNLRFVLVFKPNNVLPVSFITVNAAKQNNDVDINWTVAESNIASYQVQKSSNAIEFATIGSLVANGSSNASTQKYNWIDTKPFNGNNYYRINAIGKDGKVTNSSIVLVKVSDKNSITVYPNPVKDRRMNILTESLAKGNYEIQLFNLEGKTVYNYSLKHLGGNASFVVNLPLSVSAGMYQMVIKGKDYNNSQNIIVE